MAKSQLPVKKSAKTNQALAAGKVKSLSTGTKRKEKTDGPSATEAVDAYLGKLAPDLRLLVEQIRKTVLETDLLIGEQIKWNSPAFYYTGDMKAFDPKEYKRDLLVINLHRGKPLLVFPTGATIPDKTGLLEGTYTDGRRMINISDPEDLKKKKAGLQTVIRAWLKQVEKA